MPPGTAEKDMHRRVDWMVSADSSILRYMDAAVDERGKPAIQTPITIALNTGYSNRHIANRCKVLVEQGLLEQLNDQAHYRISDKGKGLLDGSICPSLLNEESE